MKDKIIILFNNFKKYFILLPIHKRFSFIISFILIIKIWNYPMYITNIQE